MDLSSRYKTFLIPLGLLFLVLIFSTYWFFFRPPSGPSLTKVIMVKKGMPLRKISAMLEQEGIIRNSQVFTWIATLRGKKSGIKAGEYEFHAGMSFFQVLDALEKGQAKHHLVTIAEGYTLSQIAQLLDELKIVGKKEFLEKASSPALILSLGLPFSASSKPAPSLEGYLFPNTYNLMRETTPEEIIQVMVQQFNKVFNKELIHRGSQLGLSQKEVVILASIIEKETSLTEEKPLVSAVFHNRLKKKIPLQSDPTVIYGIKNFNGNLTKVDLQRPTPYNTYLINGLPPTPICNPGKDSILAALYPSPVSYLYFVSKNDGSHYFASNFEEHNRAVWKYQKYPRKNNLTRK
jgi:UPF0755 protein